MTYVFDELAEPRYSTADIAKATGVSAETIRTWFKRNVLSFDRDGMGEDVKRIGLGRNYSAYTALVIAIMGKLTRDGRGRGGMTPDEARAVAYHFLSSSDDRFPGFIYEHGETLLVINKDGPNGPFVRIVNAGGNGYGDAKALRWDELFGLFGGSSNQIEVICLTELWQGVTSLLGIRSQLERRWKK